MSTSELPTSETSQTPAAASYGLLLVTFIAAIFVSAALLFAVQPMFTKMVLPRLGGAASVWSVAMVFFQTTLLAGYAYAHLLTRFQPGRNSIIIHLVVLAAACLLLPLHIASGWGRPPQVGEAFWLLGLFAVSIGLPFFALSANGPLLQAWFVRTGHPDAKDPYFLYAASNVGSFLALIAYPVAVEPFVRLSDQTWLWTAGYYASDRAGRGCGFLMLRSPNRLPEATTSDTTIDDCSGGSDLARQRDLGRAGGGAVRPADRGYRAHRDRRRLGAAVLDHPARDLPADVRHRLSDPSVHPAFAGRRGAAGVRAVPRYCDPDDSDRVDRPSDRDPSQRVLRLRLDVPRRIGAPPSAAAVPDLLLHVDLVRRHDRRHPDRPDCAADIHPDHRISAADRAHAAVPPRLRHADPRQRPVRAADRGRRSRPCCWWAWLRSTSGSRRRSMP